MKILIKKKEVIALIDKNEINIMTTALIKRIKKNLKTKCNLNVKIDEISKIFMKIKREMLKKSTFRIIDNVRSFMILKKQ